MGVLWGLSGTGGLAALGEARALGRKLLAVVLAVVLGGRRVLEIFVGVVRVGRDRVRGMDLFRCWSV